jgi:hypothetical protein
MKRSSQVALLLMGTVAVGGGAYALMPSENCPPNQPGVVQPGGQPQNQNCHRSWRSSGGGSSGYSGYHSGYGGSSSSSSSPHLSSQQHFSGSGTAFGGSSSTSPVSRGGFGSFSSHFSGGG